jgi:pimeloyl-ACP methyl ester carboxylesterase
VDAVTNLARRTVLACAVFASVFASAPARSAERWTTLPPTPTLPAGGRTGYVSADGARLWYAVYGTGTPVIFLHGGLANAGYWGLQVRALSTRYQTIVMDSRCHGRSTCGSAPLGYHRMAEDVLALMDALHIEKAALAGWSDGAITSLDLAVHHPDRVSGVFAFAANSNPSGTKDVSASPVFNAYLRRVKGEYAQLSPTPAGFETFFAAINRMWATQPNFSRSQLAAIGVPVWIVDADRDEAIKRSDTDYLAATIPGAGEFILPNVSHFAFLQDPAMFDSALSHFLAQL